jgi:tetratricopeptide (TPR) repeat protein
MAAVMLANQKNELALSYYKRLIELEPNNFQTYYKMGMYHLGIDNYNAALESFTKSTQINPQDAREFF